MRRCPARTMRRSWRTHRSKAAAARQEGGRHVAHRFPALIAAPPAGQGRLWLTGARLWDGTGAPLRENAAVLVEDGIIRRVADATEPCPDGARPLDLGQRVLMPGLTDAHTHASGSVPHTAKGAEEALPGVVAHFMQAELRDYLRFGVTTIRVTGSQGLLPQQARQAMRYGAFRGPRLLTCGKIISATAPGGRFYGDMYREADGEDDVRRAVREQIRWGADFVKVMTTGARSNELEDPDPLQFTDPELAAVTDEAHRLGYRVSAHAEGLDGCAAAIKARRRHDRARHVPEPAAGSAGRHGRRGPGAGAHAVWLLLDVGPGRGGHRPHRRAGPAGHAAGAGGTGPAQPERGGGQHAGRPQRRGQDRARQRHQPGRRPGGPAHDPSRPDIQSRPWSPRPGPRPKRWAWTSTSGPSPKASSPT